MSKKLVVIFVLLGILFSTNIYSKSFGKAMLMSAVLPGTGEYYLGHSNIAQGFWVADGVLWLGYGITTTMVEWKKDDYELFAKVKANAYSNNLDNQFYINLAKYEDVYAYNERVRSDARDKFTINSDEYWDYIAQNSYDPETTYWKWNNTNDQDEYKGIRYLKGLWDKRSSYVVTALLINRLISVIDVLKLTRQADNATTSWDFKVIPDINKTTVKFSLRW